MILEVTRGTISEPEATALATRADTEQSILPAPTSFVPVCDVRDYLCKRQPTPHYADEQALFLKLPDAIKADLVRLLGDRPGRGAFGRVWDLTHGRHAISVSAAVAEARKRFKVSGSLKRIRDRYDLWVKTKDWICLVNRAKAGAEWTDRKDGLPLKFLRFASVRLGKFQRPDAKRQALLSIHRQWETGINEEGIREPIPGFGFWEDWFKTRFPGVRLPIDPPALPGGSYDNVMRQIKAANKFPKVVEALLHEGDAAAKAFIPDVHFDRNTAGADGGPLRFLEIIEFDDVRCDFSVLDDLTGQACDLWLLIARDKATGMLLGFGMRPARSRDDGSQEHLKLRDMKQLAGWILERYGLPPYLTTWRLERGTATLPEAIRLALRQMLPERINISYTGMITGKSAVGYDQRAIGNSKGKGSLESHNRLQHTMASHLPGQIARVYGKRPADHVARIAESEEIWEATQHLPEHVRSKVSYTVLTINEAREWLHKIFQLQNERDDHALQGFEDVVEWYEPKRGEWLNRTTYNGLPGAKFRKRKEKPIERCARLVEPYRAQWESVSPDVIRALYIHTIREVVVKDSGLIKFQFEDRQLEFKPGPGLPALVPGTKLLGYLHPDEPKFLFLYHPSDKGGFVGVWVRTGYAKDRQTLDDAIRYQKSVLNAAKEMAADYASEARAALEKKREDNAALIAAHTFTEVAIAPQPTKQQESPIARGLASIRRKARQQKDDSASDQTLAESLDEA